MINKIKNFLVGAFNILNILMPTVVLVIMIYFLYQGNWTVSKVMNFLFLCVLSIIFSIEDKKIK